jgi:hypothetical protein
MNSVSRLINVTRALSICASSCLILSAIPAKAADLSTYDRSVLESRPAVKVRGRALPDCTETRPDHLIACAPRELVLIEPDAPIANAVYALRPSHPRRPYPQIFTWGP